jgi:hypothetical protein
MNLTLLDAPVGKSFVLGDTPMPQSKLERGFRVTLSQSLAVEVLPGPAPKTALARRTAKNSEVDDINREQWENASEIVIGPDPAALKKLSAKGR